MSVATPSLYVQRLLHSSLQYARVRLEILELELIEERQRISSMIIRGVLLSLTALMAVQFAAGLVVAAFWDTPWRLHALGALILLALLATAAAWSSLRRLRKEPARPLTMAMRDIDRAVAPEAE